MSTSLYFEKGIAACTSKHRCEGSSIAETEPKSNYRPKDKEMIVNSKAYICP